MPELSEIEQLIYLFAKLPGLGQRSARRIVLYLLQDKDIRINSFMTALSNVADSVVKCKICANIDNTEICSICKNQNRDSKTIAVVETVADLWALERGGIFNGKYHVLGGSLSTGANHTTGDLRLPELLKRCQDEGAEEIIIATNATLEGQTTAYFITEYFKGSAIKISRIASGVPFGGELDYLDEGTLSAAIKQRQPFS